MSRTERFLYKLFGRPEGWLGAMGGRIMAHANGPFAAWVLDRMAVQPIDRVLEIGFGPGVAIELLAARAARGLVAGIDPSSAMLRQAHRRNAAVIGEGRVELRLGTAESLPFGDESFDKALSINSMQLWTNVAAGLREVRRVVKKDGLIALGFTIHARLPQSAAVATLRTVGWANPKVLTSRRGYCVLIQND